MKLLLFMVFVYINFRIWTRIRIRNPRVTNPDPAKVKDLADPDSQRSVIEIRKKLLLLEVKAT
jgi:hypothetical protein